MHPRSVRRLWKAWLALLAVLCTLAVQAQQSESAPQATPVTNATAAQNPAQATPTPVSATAAAAFGEIRGIVISGNTPLPGVTVSAANSLTGKKYLTSTDVDGTYRILI